MTDEEYTHIYVSKSNKEKLEDLKIFERETINSILGELIKFGEENKFRNIRIKNLTKNLEENNASNKIKQESIGSVTIR